MRSAASGTPGSRSGSCNWFSSADRNVRAWAPEFMPRAASTCARSGEHGISRVIRATTPRSCGANLHGLGIESRLLPGPVLPALLAPAGGAAAGLGRLQQSRARSPSDRAVQSLFGWLARKDLRVDRSRVRAQ